MDQDLSRTDFVHRLEDPGLLLAEEEERTLDITQEDIVVNSPLAVTQQYFNIKLNQLGPYSLSYSRNGRHLLLGGRKGHVATLDWRTKNLGCEIQVKEATRDIHFLHDDLMFAAAQKQFVYIYDKTGTEIHCVSKMTAVNKLTFLPYHFLLVSGNEFGVLGYLDVSIGQFVTRHFTGLGPLRALCSNPNNGVVHLGHSNGTVTLWTPNLGKPAVKMLCHKGGISDIAIEKEGRYMVTTGYDAKMRVWDIRQYKPLNCFTTNRPASSLDISQRGLVAFGHGSYCEIWQDVFTKSDSYTPYLCYQLPGQLHKLQFCPFEDCLGLGHSNGFSSIIVPGSGEPNIDGLEVNPYQSKRQKQEWEVKALLEKIPSDLIVLEPQQITRVKTGSTILTSNEKDSTKQKIIKPVLKLKLRGRSTPGKLVARKQALRSAKERVLRRAKRKSAHQTKQGNDSILDRFK